MDNLKSHPLEFEVDKIIKDLGGELYKMKETFDSGTIYRLNWDDMPLCIALPTYVPTTCNVFRIEFTLGEVDAKNVGRILLMASLDMDMHRNVPLRVIPRIKDNRVYEIILQSVSEFDLVQAGFVRSTVLYGAELAQYYRNEFLSQTKAA